VRRPDDGPSLFAWLVAFISVALPWVGATLGIYGGWQLSQGEREGWWWLCAGGALIIADILIDLVWAHPSISASDQPDLNQRGAQLVGRVFVVTEAIDNGRGKIRVGDTLWHVEGADCPHGTRVRVEGVRGTALLVAHIGDSVPG
jgi:membrane protein implicated in regulation of membrane protease activity